MAMISSMSALWPKRWTGMIARVRGVIASAMRSTSMLNVSGSMSTKTGRAPSRDTEPAVAKNEYGDVSTSSPALMPSAISASSSASVPDDTATACSMPSRRASSPSSCSTSGPMMKRWLSATRVSAARISSRIGRYCACRSSKGTDIVDILSRSPPRLDRRPGLAIRFAALDRLALVVLLLAPGEADRDLHPAVLVVQPDRHQGHAFFDRLANQLPDLVAIEQQLAAAQRLVVRVAAMTVGADVD